MSLNNLTKNENILDKNKTPLETLANNKNNKFINKPEIKKEKTNEEKAEDIKKMKNAASNFFNFCKEKLNTQNENKTTEKIKPEIKEKSEQEKFNEFPQEIKYKKFKKFISIFQKNQENNLIKKLQKRQKIDFNIKEKSIKKFIENFSNKKNIKKEDLEILKEFSYSEFGYLKNEHRMKLYRILFMIENQPNDIFEKKISYIKSKDTNKKNEKFEKKFKEVYSTIEKTESDTNNNNNFNTEELILNKSNNLFYKSQISKWNSIRYESVIEVDIKRTICNSIFKENSEMEIMLSFLKSQITNKLKIFFSLFNEFTYYQGFHDIAIFIYLLITSEDENSSEENDDILLYEILQRLCEFFFKDYLTEFEYKIFEVNKVTTKKAFFSFENIHLIVNNILKKNDKKLFNFIQEKSDFPEPIYSLSWILTYFTHDIKNLNLVYRIFDYLFIEHPMGIYFLSSNVNF